MTTAPPNLAQSTPTPAEQNTLDGITLPPTNLYSHEPLLESSLHLSQLILLLACLNWAWKTRDDYFAAGNMTVYYSAEEIKTKDLPPSETLRERGPDFFVVLGVEQRPRKSWIVWEEGGKYPNVIVELLSDSTAAVDRGLKKALYQDVFRTLDYFWFDPESLEFEGFQLVSGQYEAIPANEQGWRWSPQLEMFLGVHEGQLRFFSPVGELLPTPEEAAEAERQQKEIEQQQKERLAAKLRELGVDPEQL
ncbi:MAG: Uma2 family endonuclease [Cyanobacteria bacterium P01_A01_bin.135]